ncbi:transglutaminase family protein [Aquipuribacter sp. MA13-6]|uniref:transglutaminase family protein n=1 Tax=unclassified Aquipuribacter TaxID=2635084 RepID=UPI003EEA9504
MSSQTQSQSQGAQSQSQGGRSQGMATSRTGRSVNRLRIVHTTTIQYDRPVRTSYNELRMTPATQPGQTALEARIEVSPRASAFRYRDYWGSEVVAFDTQVPHTRLDVVATSLVEVEQADDAVPEGLSWQELADEQVRDDHVEWLGPRPVTRLGPDLVQASREVAAGLEPHQAALAVSAWVGEHMQYVPGVTGVKTSAEEAWAEGRGVCQDFVHIALGALRGLGIPARYVSGYLHPDPGAEVGRTVTGQSHAWLEWWVGAWYPFDPTNGRSAGLDHVVVAHGRDYGDVPPFRGVVSGGAGSRMDVQVDLTRQR